MSDNFDTQVKFGADTGNLKDGMTQAAQVVAQGTKAMEASLRESMDKIRSNFAKGFTLDTSSFDQMKAKAKETFESTRTAEEMLASKQAELNSLFKAGAIDSDTYKRALDNLKNGSGGAGSAIQSLGGQVKALGLSFIGVAAAINLGRSIVTTAANFESLEIQLRAVMGSAAQGDQAFAWIKQFAVETPFSVESTTKAFMQLKNFGLDPMDGTLQKLADASAKYGAGADSMQRVTLAMGQAWARGKLQGQDILQMIDAGIPVYDMLTKATGKTAAQLQEMSEKGTITRDVMRKLIDELGKESAGTSDARMNSLAGAMSNMGDAYANAIDSIRQKGGFAFLTDSVQGLTDIIPSAVAMFAEMGSAIGDVLTQLWGVVKDVFGAIGAAITAVFGGGSTSLSAMQIFINMLKVVQVAIIGLRIGMSSAFSIIKTVLAEAANYFVTFANVASRALHLDFSGAKAALTKGMDDAKAIAKQGMADIVDIASKGREKIDGVLLGTGSSAPKIGNTTPKADTGGNASKTGAAKAATDIVAIWRASLEQQKEDQGQYFKDSTQSDITFWESKLALVKKGSKEARAIGHELYNLHKQEARQSLANDLQDINSRLADTKAGSEQRIQLANDTANRIGQSYGIDSRQYKQALEASRKEARAWEAEQIKSMQAMRDANQKYSQDILQIEENELAQKLQMERVSNAEYAQQLIALKDQEYNIEADAINAKLQLGGLELAAKQQLNDQLLVLERKHALDVQKINDTAYTQQVAGYTKTMSGVTNAFSTSINGMILGTTTFSKAMANMGQSILGEFTKMAVSTLTKWIATELAKTNATTVGSATRLAVTTTAAAAGKSVEATTGLASVMANAYKAGAGAYAAIVGIPYVGPFLAPAAAAVAFTATAAFGSGISAEGGYDIPAGVNPLVQTHQREMILPAEHADTIRGLAGGGAGGGETHVHFHSMMTDRRSVENFFKQNSSGMAAGLRNVARNFVPAGAKVQP